MQQDNQWKHKNTVYKRGMIGRRSFTRNKRMGRKENGNRRNTC